MHIRHRHSSLTWAIATVLIFLMHPFASHGQDVAATTFADYASSPTLTPDATYTVELLIDRVRGEFDSDYWDDWSMRNDARETSNYKPQFSVAHVRPAEKELQGISWLSLQRTRNKQRPVRDLSPLRFLPKLSGLVLSNNEVSDISPIATCTELKRLILSQNPIRDISALANCLTIEDLEINGTPIEDLSVLEKLPKLSKLSISANQVPALKRLSRLPALRKLELGSDTFDSFEGFPEMPELRVIFGVHVERLDGLDRFPKLENLVNLSGAFDSLEPLRHSKALTHVNILSSSVHSLKPLAELHSLRDLWIHTDATTLDLSPLSSLTSLHKLSVECNGKELASLDEFRSTLPSWDVEFRASTPRYTPSLELDIVDQKTFDVYDTEKSFNITESDTNLQLLESELEWLENQIEDVLSKDLKQDEDYMIPFQWGEARSRTVVILSEKAVAAFPRLVLSVQKVLSSARNDWIIYFQSEDDTFIVWIYPNKIMVTEEYAPNVRKLIESSKAS